jgi:hypothetical protein
VSFCTRIHIRWVQNPRVSIPTGPTAIPSWHGRDPRGKKASPEARAQRQKCLPSPTRPLPSYSARPLFPFYLRSLRTRGGVGGAVVVLPTWPRPRSEVPSGLSCSRAQSAPLTGKSPTWATASPVSPVLDPPCSPVPLPFCASSFARFSDLRNSLGVGGAVAVLPTPQI